MKKIEIIIKPENKNVITKKLGSLGLKKVNISEIKNTDIIENKYTAEIKLEFVVKYTEVDKFVEAVKESFQTGVESGKIFVSPVENAVDIKTSLEGVEAL